VTAFALTEEQQAFARRVRAIAAEELRPLAEAGPPGHVNRELVKAMGQLGLLSHQDGCGIAVWVAMFRQLAATGDRGFQPGALGSSGLWVGPGLGGV